MIYAPTATAHNTPTSVRHVIADRPDFSESAPGFYPRGGGVRRRRQRVHRRACTRHNIRL